MRLAILWSIAGTQRRQIWINVMNGYFHSFLPPVGLGALHYYFKAPCAQEQIWMFAEPLDGARTVEGHLEEAATRAYYRQRRSAVCRYCDILNARPIAQKPANNSDSTELG